MVQKHIQKDALEEKITKVVRKEISSLVTNKQFKSSVEFIDGKINGAVELFNDKIDSLAKMNIEMDKKFDTLITNMDEFIGRIDSEEVERKSSYRLLERRIEKLEEKVS
jgi:predicted RNase H-like nuclease (RuvC/YqgF family)